MKDKHLNNLLKSIRYKYNTYKNSQINNCESCIEDIAIELIQYFKVRKAPVEIIDIATRLGFKVYRIDLPFEISGYINIDGELKDYLKSDKIIIINNRHGVKYRREAVACAIYKYLFEFDPDNMIEFKSDLNNTNKDSDMNIFASALLMPYKHIEKILPRINLLTLTDSNIGAISNYFLVSVEMANDRLIRICRKNSQI